MIFAKKKKILVWCDEPQEDPVISVFAGCLANHDRAHSPHVTHRLFDSSSVSYSLCYSYFSQGVIDLKS
jgi:hypothetical protein